MTTENSEVNCSIPSQVHSRLCVRLCVCAQGLHFPLIPLLSLRPHSLHAHTHTHTDTHTHLSAASRVPCGTAQQTDRYTGARLH